MKINICCGLLTVEQTMFHRIMSVKPRQEDRGAQHILYIKVTFHVRVLEPTFPW